MQQLVAAQMDGTFFPITPRQVGACATCRDLHPRRHTLQGIEVEAFMLLHVLSPLGAACSTRGAAPAT
jgi:hypothetical protein